MRRWIPFLAVALALATLGVVRGWHTSEPRAGILPRETDPRAAGALERVRLEQELIQAEKTAILYGELFAATEARSRIQ